MTQITTKLECIKLIFVLFLSLGMTVACSQKEIPTNTDSTQTNAESPEIGADIKNVVKTPSNKQATGGVRKIMWDDLIPADFQPDVIVKKYKKQVDSISEGENENNAKTQALMDKIMAEFNNAPANKELDGVKVKIPGFVALLDEKDGMVSEFLLVPYFGSCVHSPPPPVNQTVLVITKEGKSIRVENTNKPVWVTGTIKVEKKETELAKAGYVIQDAELEIYNPYSNPTAQF